MAGDVSWFIPGRKRPVMYSTVATKDWIDMLTAADFTIDQMWEASEMDADARKILDEYRKRGYGDCTGYDMNFEGCPIPDEQMRDLCKIFIK